MSMSVLLLAALLSGADAPANGAVAPAPAPLVAVGPAIWVAVPPLGPAAPALRVVLTALGQTGPADRWLIEYCLGMLEADAREAARKRQIFDFYLGFSD